MKAGNQMYSRVCEKTALIADTGWSITPECEEQEQIGVIFAAFLTSVLLKALNQTLLSPVGTQVHILSSVCPPLTNSWNQMVTPAEMYIRSPVPNVKKRRKFHRQQPPPLQKVFVGSNKTG